MDIDNSAVKAEEAGIKVEGIIEGGGEGGTSVIVSTIKVKIYKVFGGDKKLLENGVGRLIWGRGLTECYTEKMIHRQERCARCDILSYPGTIIYLYRGIREVVPTSTLPLSGGVMTISFHVLFIRLLPLGKSE